MKKSEFIETIIRFLEIRLKIDEGCRSGSTQEGRFLELRGSFPQLSNAKPDQTASKAERIRDLKFTQAEASAGEIFFSLCDLDQKILLAHALSCKQHNPKTGKPFTHEDCSEMLKLSYEHYVFRRKSALKFALSKFKKTMARYK